MSTDMLSYGVVELTRAEASKISGGLLFLVAAAIGFGATFGTIDGVFMSNWLVKHFHR
ncbi:hypothetical protein ACCT14_34390 [Rhizobium brockwellii]|uniref:hypothetical protein n=1 Tax=Rhizobium brockwellii TaxID=3019932 RepID=UPI003F992124